VTRQAGSNENPPHALPEYGAACYPNRRVDRRQGSTNSAAQ